MVNANDFCGKNDSDVLNNAVRGRGDDGIVVIPSRRSDIEPERDFWLLDAAVLIPENTTVVLQNCKLKLSDRARDNFFRSANCGLGIEFPERIHNITLRGEGTCVLEGADHPRASGDASKILRNPCPHFPEDICRLADWIPDERRTPEKIEFSDVHTYSYGTDAGRIGESQCGDWRGIGILFANVEGFSISGVRIVESHGWGISLEECANGRIERIDFDARMHKCIDGIEMNMENQDGIDVRNGCHDILISDITGCTGDDVIALTAIARGGEIRPGGFLGSTHVMHNDWTKRDKDIHDIVIRNVKAHSYLCYTVRLLPAMTHIYNVVIEGVVDTSPTHGLARGTLLFGDGGTYGENLPDSIRNVTVSDVICNSKHAIIVRGYLTDSVINNVVNRNPDCPPLTLSREDGLNNVTLNNLVSAVVDR